MAQAVFVNPNPIDFGSLKVGTASSSMAIEFDNTCLPPSRCNPVTVTNITSSTGQVVLSGLPTFPVVVNAGVIPGISFSAVCTPTSTGLQSFTLTVTYNDGASTGLTLVVPITYYGVLITPAFTLTGDTKGVMFSLGGSWTSGPNNYLAQSLSSIACEADCTLQKMIDFGEPTFVNYVNRLFMRIDPLGFITATATAYSDVSGSITSKSDIKNRPAAGTDNLGIPDEMIFDLEANAEIILVTFLVTASIGILSIQNLIPAYETRGSVYESS